jgi:hypothetical protein
MKEVAPAGLEPDRWLARKVLGRRRSIRAERPLEHFLSMNNVLGQYS